MSAQDTLLVFADAGGVPRRWLLLSGGAVVGRGDDVGDLPEARPWVRVVLAVPGTEVTMRWLELAEGLPPAQAAAAARLQAADESAAPVGDLFVAAGRREAGLTAIALVPAERMAAWLGEAQAQGLEPDVVIPEPMLLLAPGEGLVRYRPDVGPCDYRGLAQAFSLEDDLAALVLRDTPVREADESAREAGYAPVLAQPPINLRQGAFARRREWAIDWRRTRWLAALIGILLLVSLAHQMTVILRTATAADRYQAEAIEARRALGSGPRAGQAGAAYGPVASALFDAIRDVPQVELTQIGYGADGALQASLSADSPATLAALQQRIESRGMIVQAGVPTPIGPRTAAQLTIRRR